MRRALAINEGSYGPYHPNIAIDLNNLAEVLKDTNRMADAEALNTAGRADSWSGFSA